jgi:hypothetical protein
MRSTTISQTARHALGKPYSRELQPPYGSHFCDNYTSEKQANSRLCGAVSFFSTLEYSTEVRDVGLARTGEGVLL